MRQAHSRNAPLHWWGWRRWRERGRTREGTQRTWLTKSPTRAQFGLPSLQTRTHHRPGGRVTERTTAFEPTFPRGRAPSELLPLRGATTRLALGGHGRQHGRPGRHTVTGPPARQRPAVPCCLPSQGSRERPARRRCGQRARAATRRTHPSTTHREKGRRQGTQADGGPKESPARLQRRSPPSPHHLARLSPRSCFLLSPRSYSLTKLYKKPALSVG